MLREQTLQTLRQLKLPGMAAAFSNQLEQPKSYDLAFEERLALLIEAEKIYRRDKKLERLLKAAKLRYNACVEDIDYTKARGLEKEKVASLLSCQWIQESLNVIITGPTGTGKSWLGCALGQQACRQGLTVVYLRFSTLLEKMRLSRADGTYAKFLGDLAKTDLLILDDWLLEALESKDRHGILDIMEDRYERKSLVITTQIPRSSWHEKLSDPTLADAILDRVLSQSIDFELKGESMRKLKKKRAP